MKYLITLVCIFLLGCAGQQQPAANCVNLNKIVEAYQASLLVRQPTEEETRYALAAKAILIMYCGEPGSVIPLSTAAKDLSVGQLPFPRQPKKFAVKVDGKNVWWYRAHEFLIIQDPTGVFSMKKDNLATITTGPFYRRAYSTDLYMPDAHWLQFGPGDPIMSPIR